MVKISSGNCGDRLGAGMNKRGNLIVVSGPSGVGKGSITDIVRAKDEKIAFSVSATTRKPREKEVDGVHYYFMDEEEFIDKIENSEFLEYNKHFNNYYGTLKSEVEKYLSVGKDVILDIEVKGALKLKRDEVDAIFVFILPPSIEELRNRILKRGSEDEKMMLKRLDRSLMELSHIDYYDYYVINDDLESASENLLSIIKASRYKVKSDITTLVSGILK